MKLEIEKSILGPFLRLDTINVVLIDDDDLTKWGEIIHRINIYEELIEALNRAVNFQIKLTDAINQDADWFNNNMLGVGQNIAYKEKAPVPEWVIQAKQALQKATNKTQGEGKEG